MLVYIYLLFFEEGERSELRICFRRLASEASYEYEFILAVSLRNTQLDRRMGII